MPQKVLPTRAEFEALFRRLGKVKFRKITSPEFTSSFKRLGLKAPRPRPGREVGYTFHANGYQVVVWTTYVESLESARETDAGWVLILDGDKIVYSTRPKMRTAGFIDRLFKYARVAQLRVLSRPTCPTCKAWMHIVHGKGFKSCYWRCQSGIHSQMERLSFDHGLTPAALDFVRAERKKRKGTGKALAKRKRWAVTRPENLR